MVHEHNAILWHYPDIESLHQKELGDNVLKTVLIDEKRLSRIIIRRTSVHRKNCLD